MGWGGAGRGEAEMGRGGSKMSKSILILSRGAGLKSHSIPTLPPLWGGENPRKAKRRGLGEAH